MSIKKFSFLEIGDKAVKIKRLFEKFESYSEEFIVDEDEVLKTYDFAPLIATICDEKISAKVAWSFPSWLSGKLNIDLTLENLINLDFKSLLREYLEGKWPSGMSRKNREEYLRKVSSYIKRALRFFGRLGVTPVSMFEDREYSSLEVYFMLRRIPGIGPKKANTIVRDFLYASLNVRRFVSRYWFDQIKKRYGNFRVKDERLLDIPIDVQVVKVFNRIFGRRNPSGRGGWRDEILRHVQDIIAFSKLVFPDFPAKLDELFWNIGRKYCDERNPKCSSCPLYQICEIGKLRRTA